MIGLGNPGGSGETGRWKSEEWEVLELEKEGEKVKDMTMIHDQGIKECEFCGNQFEWIFEQGGINNKNIKATFDNGKYFIVSIKCPKCYEVQAEALTFSSQKA